MLFEILCTWYQSWLACFCDICGWKSVLTWTLSCFEFELSLNLRVNFFNNKIRTINKNIELSWILEKNVIRFFNHFLRVVGLWPKLNLITLKLSDCKMLKIFNLFRRLSIFFNNWTLLGSFAYFSRFRLTLLLCSKLDRFLLLLFYIFEYLLFIISAFVPKSFGSNKKRSINLFFLRIFRTYRPPIGIIA